MIAVTGSLPEYDPSLRTSASTWAAACSWSWASSPVMEALLVTRTAEDTWSRMSLFETDLPALKNAAAPRHFSF